MQAQQVFIGVDVAKDSLVSCIHGLAKPQVVANEERAIKGWLKTLAPQAVIGMESTGRYHQSLARLAHQAGLRVYVLNAKDVYFYAKALGARGKTDPGDARVIARYVAEHHAALQRRGRLARLRSFGCKSCCSAAHAWPCIERRCARCWPVWRNWLQMCCSSSNISSSCCSTSTTRYKRW